MYKLVKRILDKSRETGEDIFVAREMCVAEDKENADELREAAKLIKTHYDAITKCRREKDEESIEQICILVEKGDKPALKEFIEEIKAR